MFSVPAASAALLIPFLPPLFAGRYKTLWKGVLIAFVPAIMALGLTLVPGGGAMFAVFLGCFVAALFGSLARGLSLLGPKFGVPRPYSLVIEATFLAVAGVIIFVLADL